MLPTGNAHGWAPIAVTDKRSGERFFLLGTGPDCTNKRDGTLVAHYVRETSPSAVPYVCELAAFWNTFQADPVCAEPRDVSAHRASVEVDIRPRLQDWQLAALPVTHLKTGNAYLLLGVGVDCTEERSGTLVAHYVKQAEPYKLPFVRELQEFSTKFRGTRV